MSFLRAFLALLLVLTPLQARAATSDIVLPVWADSSLPVKTGLTLWLDATRQPAAWAAHKKQELVDGDALDLWYDSSPNARDFLQTSRDAQPKFLGNESAAALRFDGAQDHLLWSGNSPPLKSFTAIILAAPRSNEGDFRAFLAARETGKNDYNTGFNIDLGPHPAGGDGYTQLNVEGPGFIGQANLLKSLLAFDKLQTFSLTCAPGKSGVQLFVNGKLTGQRDRGDESLATTSLSLGARCYSNEDAPPCVTGFLEGDIAEVLLYDRVLSPDERAAIESYLAKKHARTQEVLSAAGQTGQPLVRLKNPPEFQMFLPGFAARKLPLDLTNINNVRYRDDGKVLALAYDGNIYLLSDTNNDGLEDKADLFYESKGNIVAPIGMAVTPPNYKHGRGAFVASKGKVSLIVDTNNDDKADNEIVVASGWPGTFHPIDAVGVTVADDQSIYFGLGCANFVDAFQRDKQGKAQYSLTSERGTIMRIAPDLSKREIICTGIRFPVGMALNSLGDLFVTDQEGATWLPNGNPFDELLHIQPARHYGFPPRHPTYLPNVVDEPSVFDYAPQHQSTCGLLFNGPTVFGPESWRGDAIVCGESRGKLFRTQLVKTPAGYVARNHIIASMPTLLIDAAVSPAGDLLLTSHSGNPDWGTGPTGHGHLYKVSYTNRDAPQPILCYPTSPGELHLVFDRPLTANSLDGISKRLSIEYGAYVGAGDRFEKIYPGYAAVKRQMRAPRHNLPIAGVQISPDRRSVIIHTPPQSQAHAHALTLESPEQPIDLAYDLTGVLATWQPANNSAPQTLWLPHPDPTVSRAFTANSSHHDLFFQSLKSPGKVTLQTQLDLKDMLRPAIQPGSKLDHTFPPESITITFESNSPIDLQSPGLHPTHTAQGNTFAASLTLTPKPSELLPLRLTLSPSSPDLTLRVHFSTNEDPRPRALPLRRFLLPWARLPSFSESETETKTDIPELAGGDWLRGRSLFYGNEAACHMCHSVRGEGSDLGPDLSNLIHRDYDSVVRDLRDPSGALNPEYIASIVKLKDGRVLSGIVRNTDPDHFLVRGDSAGDKVPIPRSAVLSIKPASLSVMPKGLPEGLGKEKVRDLLTFLLTEPLAPAPLLREGAPAPRPRAELDSILKSTTRPATDTAALKPLHILLVSGPKDHGPGEHDYPLFQQRWSKLLSLSPNVTTTPVDRWPTPDQWKSARVAIFYSNNPSWTADRGAELDAFLSRGGGLLFIHYAVDGHDAPDALAQRIGLAWRGGASKFRHGPLDLTVRTDHPITRGLPPSFKLTDESYWQLKGDPSRIALLADGSEENAPRPLIWTLDHNPGRVFVSIPGHFTWTFDDPLFRLVLLRAISWTANERVDRLTDLATIGARIQN